MRRSLIIFVLALSVLQGGCNGDGDHESLFAPGPRHIVVISLDCLRADHLGCYGYRSPTSPVMDELAAEAVRFSHTTAPYNWTLPSHVSLFTGKYTPGHGAFKEYHALSEDIPHLVEPLQKAGFATAAVTGGAFLLEKYGHNRGFDSYWSADKENDQWEEILDRSEAWLKEHADEDAFLFVHTYEIHMPYITPPAYVRRILGHDPVEFSGSARQLRNYRKLDHVPRKIVDEVAGRYDAGIAYTDDLLGGFLARLKAAGLTGNMLLIVSSDHGEAFWEHGHWGHNGELLGSELTDVPLIVRLPTATFPEFTGQVVDREVSFMDIMPTVLHAAGVKGPGDLDGYSLMPELAGWPVQKRDRQARERRMVRIDGELVPLGLCESRSYVAVRAGGRKLIAVGPDGEDAAEPDWPSLYDLDADPGEMSPLPPSGENADALRRAAERLAGTPGDEGAVSEEIEIDEKTRKQLEALGYL